MASPILGNGGSLIGLWCLYVAQLTAITNHPNDILPQNIKGRSSHFSQNIASEKSPSASIIQMSLSFNLTFNSLKEISDKI